MNKLQQGFFMPASGDKKAGEIAPENGNNFQLEELQKYVGKKIEITMLTPNMKLVYNKDQAQFKEEDKHLNVEASLFHMQSTTVKNGMKIYGDVVFANSDTIIE